MTKLVINDFDVLYKCLEYASFISDDLIINVDNSKINIDIKNNIARLNIESGSITADNNCDIVLNNIKLFMVAIKNAQASIKDHNLDKIEVNVSKSKLEIKTNNSKTSIHQSNPDIISSKSTKLKSKPKSILDFTFYKDSFKKLNSSFIFIPNVEDVRIELNTGDNLDLQNKNLLGAKIFAHNTPLSNFSIIDVGDVSFIKETVPYQIILDFDRLSLLSKFSKDSDVTFSALNIPALFVENKDDYMNMSLICSILKI